MKTVELQADAALALVKKSNSDLAISIRQDGIKTYLDLDKKSILRRINQAQSYRLVIEIEEGDTRENPTLWLLEFKVEGLKMEPKK